MVWTTLSAFTYPVAYQISRVFQMFQTNAHAQIGGSYLDIAHRVRMGSIELLLLASSPFLLQITAEIRRKTSPCPRPALWRCPSAALFGNHVVATEWAYAFDVLQYTKSAFFSVIWSVVLLEVFVFLFSLTPHFFSDEHPSRANTNTKYIKVT